MNIREKQNIYVIIQARCGSSRLPGKVLKPLWNGHTTLDCVYKRLQNIESIDGIIVATSKSKTDDQVEEFCRIRNYPYYRGSENDVLSRYYNCCVEYGIENIVRVTADCPLIDPHVLEKVIKKYKRIDTDYLSFGKRGFFGDGFNVEVFPFSCLEKAYLETSDSYDREHVTPYLYKYGKFKIDTYIPYLGFTPKISINNLHLSLDTANDYKLLRSIYKKLDRIDFNISDVIHVLEDLESSK